MTTIAYRDGVLASDSLITAGDTRVGTVKKVWKAKNGTLIAFAGRVSANADIEKWVDSNLNGQVPDTSDDTAVFLVKPDKTTWMMDNGGNPVKFDAPFFAEGSGMEYALGAMAMGASAERAVEIAMLFDTHSGGPLQKVELGNVIPFMPFKKG